MNGQIRYTPGGHHLVVRAGRVAFLGSPLDPGQVERVWEHLASNRADGVCLLDLETAVQPWTTNGLNAVLVECLDSGLRVAVRGSAVVTVRVGHENRTIAATEQPLWHEDVVTGGDWWHCAITPADGEDVDAVEIGLPLENGVVHASQCTWSTPDATKGLEPDEDFSQTSPAARLRDTVSPDRAVDDLAVTLADQVTIVDHEPPDALVDDLDIDQQREAGEHSEPREVDEGFDYGALFGATSNRTVADAVVTPLDEVDDESGDGKAFARVTEAPQDDSRDGESTNHSAPADTNDEPANLHPAAERTPDPASSSPTIISRLPWEDPGAVRSPEPATAVDELGDHDGFTVRRDPSRDGANTPLVSTLRPLAVGGPSVLALLCEQGHPSPPTAPMCRECDGPLGSVPQRIARPSLGVLCFADGKTVELVRTMVIGRKPKIEGEQVGEMPGVVTFADATSVSRTHLIVRLDGWQVRFEDQGSSNRTRVKLPDRQPETLRAHQPFLVVDGTEFVLGGEVSGEYRIR